MAIVQVIDYVLRGNPDHLMVRVTESQSKSYRFDSTVLQ